MRRWVQVLLACTLALAVIGACRNRNRTGELNPPRGAPDWEGRFSVAFDDDYTREQIQLSGRAPNDVLDQRLFAARLGHSHIVALIRVDQVWGKGRYEGRRDQYLDVTLENVLMGTLPRGTHKDQLLLVTGEDDLPGALQGANMILFVRWAPGKSPAYHHHLMPAEDAIVSYIEAMVKDAQNEGVLDERGKQRKRKRRTRRSRRNARRTDTEAEPRADQP